MIIKKSEIETGRVTYHPVLKMVYYEGEMYYTVFNLDSYYWGVFETFSLFDQSCFTYEVIETDAFFEDGELKLFQETVATYRNEYEVCYYYGLSNVVTPNLAKGAWFATQEMKRRYIRYSAEEVLRELIVHLAFHLDTTIPYFDARLSKILRKVKFTIVNETDYIDIVFTNQNRAFSFFEKNSLAISGVMELSSTQRVPYELIFIDGKIEKIQLGIAYEKFVTFYDFVVQSIGDIDIQVDNNQIANNSQLDVQQVIDMIGRLFQFESNAFFEVETLKILSDVNTGKYVYYFMEETEDVLAFTTMQGTLVFSDKNSCEFLILCTATKLVSMTLDFKHPVSSFSTLAYVPNIQFLETNRMQIFTLIGRDYDETKSVPERNWIQNIFAIKIYVDGVLHPEQIYSQRQKLHFTLMHAATELSFKRFGRAIETQYVETNKHQTYYYNTIRLWPITFSLLVIPLIGFGLMFTAYYGSGLSLVIIGMIWFIMALIKQLKRTAPIIALTSSKDVIGVAVGERIGEHYTLKWLRRKNR